MEVKLLLTQKRPWEGGLTRWGARLGRLELPHSGISAGLHSNFTPPSKIHREEFLSLADGPERAEVHPGGLWHQGEGQ
jgi:hypothetical protein